MRIAKQKKGQFIIIAILMIAIMMVSIAMVMYSAVTYYKHERWEEYLAIIDNVEISSFRLVEISLANYTLTSNNTVLRDNLNEWQSAVKKAYPGFGVVIICSLANGLKYAYGENITYTLGLARHWYASTSFSAANVTLNVNITSVGLTGYKFVAPTFLRMKILNATWDSSTNELVIYLAVNKEGTIPVTNLEKNNFSINNGSIPITTLSRIYDATHGFIYKVYSETVPYPSSVEVMVIDARSIRVIANSTVTQS